MTAKEICFAVLTLLGAAVPWYYNLQFMAASGGSFSVSAFVAGGFANPAAASLSVDLLIGSAAVTIWMVAEARRLEMKNWWIYLLLIPTVAWAFACPLFVSARRSACFAHPADRAGWYLQSRDGGTRWGQGDNARRPRRT